ncbi:MULTISPECIES: hypothetical protein [Pseudonocardia]|uniref:DUF485 domain-containing protein n=2 Tax=Pseudonocardia TaxID=1847 RepID=A0A1Y2N4Y7_PSEAH|nr:MULTISPECIES: hypothetical protein [Pseudonocardia]OSY42506.1 hypothetical protein BG845_01426 [Pseudonocardia autotrophica]TDN76025.1 hypothetical protein C8E95_5211 [Pseudonocardia autotrophica]BBG00002.1 hypothetical protein Pdca_12110 [Pseudonocardia autotrophica]GEC25061.1 hypothetical protein PSA01_20900 [Pseudonocardia saturnea]
MNRPRRVAVTAPPEPGLRSRPVPSRPVPETLLDPARAELARSTRRAQVRRAVLTLVCGGLLLLGVPVLLRLAPGLSEWRVAGLPLGWIVVAWVPYPLLALLAWWHLRGAERAERSGGDRIAVIEAGSPDGADPDGAVPDHSVARPATGLLPAPGSADLPDDAAQGRNPDSSASAGSEPDATDTTVQPAADHRAPST